MSATDPLTRSVDAVAGKTGLTRDATAILFILAGVLVLIFENLLQVILGILLIVVGIVWFIDSRRRAKEPVHLPASSPPPPGP